MTVLALSPHLDDAAFSCGGTLARLAAAGRRVVVATLFTRSVPAPTGFALACQLDKGLGPEVDYMSLRRAEDEDATRALGAAAEWLPLREAPHRGYGSAAALFAGPHEDDDVGPALRAAIEDLVRRHRPTLLLAPQAVGGHVDHVQLVRALRAVSPPVSIAWWRDFPYAAKPNAPEPFADAMAALPESGVSLDAAALAARHAACAAYGSQLGFQFGGPDGLAARLAEAGPTERFRAEARAAALLPTAREAA